MRGSRTPPTGHVAPRSGRRSGLCPCAFRYPRRAGQRVPMHKVHRGSMTHGYSAIGNPRIERSSFARLMGAMLLENQIHARCLGGGRDGELVDVRSWKRRPKNVTGGRDSAIGGANDSSLAARNSWESLVGAVGFGASCFFSVSAFFASEILQQRWQGFSPLKVSLAPCKIPLSLE